MGCITNLGLVTAAGHLNTPQWPADPPHSSNPVSTAIFLMIPLSLEKEQLRSSRGFLRFILQEPEYPFLSPPCHQFPNLSLSMSLTNWPISLGPLIITQGRLSFRCDKVNFKTNFWTFCPLKGLKNFNALQVQSGTTTTEHPISGRYQHTAQMHSAQRLAHRGCPTDACRFCLFLKADRGPPPLTSFKSFPLM